MLCSSVARGVPVGEKWTLLRGEGDCSWLTSFSRRERSPHFSQRSGVCIKTSVILCEIMWPNDDFVLCNHCCVTVSSGVAKHDHFPVAQSVTVGEWRALTRHKVHMYL